MLSLFGATMRFSAVSVDFSTANHFLIALSSKFLKLIFKGQNKEQDTQVES